MFELSVACKYLIPRWRQLSVSIISMISILVISLVVWLILVFFSVTNGLESNWIEKLIALTAPVRITPTNDYYDSYYYQIDSISEDSDYTYKSIREKLASSSADPYNSDFDEEIPLNWTRPDVDEEGNLKDIVKQAFDAANQLDVSGLSVSPFETSVGNLRLTLSRDAKRQTNLNQSAYLGSFDPENHELLQTLQPLSGDDFSNILDILALSEDDLLREGAIEKETVLPKIYRKKIQRFFQNANITHLKPVLGWKIPLHLYPEKGSLEVVAALRQGRVFQMFATPGIQELALVKAEWENSWQGSDNIEIVQAPLVFNHHQPNLIVNGKEIPTKAASLFVPSHLEIAAKLDEKTLLLAENSSDLQFFVEINLQGITVKGKVPYRGLRIAKADACSLSLNSPCWAYESEGKMVLPKEGNVDAVLLPKNFKEAGVLAGDRGLLTYYTPTTSSMQEQRIPIYVAGFYDQGVIPIGGKLVWVNPEVISMVSSAYDQSEGAMGTGINVRFNDTEKAEEVKTALKQSFDQLGIGRYFKVETFREYSFTKDLLQQLRSEKNLFSLISIVIIIVACSNIVSMLIILVNDKKSEIGILRSMGASSKSIAAIFGLCGMVMGLLGSLIGILFAALTLRNIEGLISLISHLQGHELFNSHFFGEVIPNELSGEALTFVLAATVVISLISGIIPALKASLMRPSAILRSE